MVVLFIAELLGLRKIPDILKSQYLKKERINNTDYILNKCLMDM